MTPRPRPTSPTPARSAAGTGRRTIAVAVLAGALALTGCGAQDALVGLHPAPAEKTAAAPLDVEGATAVATRLLTEADAPAQAAGAAAAKAREGVLMGDALTVANARAASKVASEAATTELATAPRPTVVAQSQGRDWPRAILATTLDDATNTQFLHVMLSEKPDQPFRITASVPMFGGAALPALGDSSKGAPLLDTGAKNGLAHVPADVVTAYAGALATPKPKATNAVEVDDPFATALRTSAAAQAKALGKLATLSQTHEPLLEDAVTFRLADGGAVTFGLMRRTDTVSLKPAAKEVVLPAEYAKVTGKKKATKSFTLSNLEPFVMVVPTSGKAKVIGATELLTSGKAR
ncbi:MAG TPA: hypothetical protein VFU25_00515 [Ornithinibacter sp.]|nr:hypothetical protein [Ornithinibacter sp.]